MTDWGAPCLSDFGLSKVYHDDPSWHTSASVIAGSVRWMSPELLTATNKVDITVQSDVYAYGITCWVIFVLSYAAKVEPYSVFRK